MKKKHFNKLRQVLGSIATTTGPHIAAIAIAIGFYLACSWWLDTSVSASDLDSSIQLLTQVLAVSVTIMLVGVTVYSSSYDISDSVDGFSKTLKTAMRPFLDLFFEKTKTGMKYRTKSFRRSLEVFPPMRNLEFYAQDGEERETYFIYRWDGVWYWTHECPFSDEEDRLFLGLVGAYHELAIMAYENLAQVRHLRDARLDLVSEKRGTNGSRWFLERLKESSIASAKNLPPSISPDEARELIFHAFAAQHYMGEEFSRRQEEVDWSPDEVTRFYAIYIEYLITLTQFVEKVQKVRMFNVLTRFPETENAINQRANKVFHFELIYKCRSELFELKKKIISVRGVAKYFSGIRRASIPGIGFALLILFMILLCWPFVKFSMTISVRLKFFSALYGLGISALFESAIFLVGILWDRRSSKRRPH
ncbi:hypothetical protein PQR29_22355 [Paraburkholderia strydomiana]|uniref:hypothetical protein n=1 Tax=Paraburkholderia strydomiana TaxID=1245417 RepID=UPI0038BA76C7